MADESQEAKCLKEIPVSEILVKIENGEPVEYDHVIIKGDLDIGKLNLPLEICREQSSNSALDLQERLKIIVSPILIRNSIINGAVIFSANFHNQVNFKGTEFSRYIDFKGSQFNKDAIFQKVRIKGDASFCGVRFYGKSLFNEAKFSGRTYFIKATFTKSAEFGGYGNINASTFERNANFKGATFNGNAYFAMVQFNMLSYFDEGVHFNKDANFRGAQFRMESCFNGAKFKGRSFFDEGAKFTLDAHFIGAQFDLDAYFIEGIFLRDVDFTDVLFNGNAHLGMDYYHRKTKFYGKVNFTNAIFSQFAYIKGADFLGNVASITFRDAKFSDSRSQESVCKLAKRILEDYGDQEESDYHFYREMDARRKQKSRYKKYPELLLIQWIFGYGVYPFRIIGFWLFVIFVFASIYWYFGGVEKAGSPINSLAECIYFSLVSAATPGYGGYQPRSGFFVWLAVFEAIFGTFMWAAFIATFARKFMR
jgi:hypothetical protein